MTPALSLLLTTCALLAAPAAEDGPSARAEATLRRVAKLPAEEQQIWLRLIEQRYGWAALVVMKPDDATRERERVAKILHQQAVGWNDMVALLRELDQREKSAVSHMVRVYRSEVYDNFHKRETEFVQRQEAWFRVWSAWEKAGSPPDQQDRLMDWLADAIKASSKDSLGPLPADPRFGADVELVPEALVKRLREEQSKQRVVEALPAPRREAAPAPVPQIPLSGPLSLRIPDPAWSLVRADMPGNGFVARRDEAALPPQVAGVPPVRAPLLASWPELASGDPLALAALPPPPRAVAALDVDCKVADTSQTTREAVAAGDGAIAGPQALAGTRSPAELPPQSGVAPPAESSLGGIAPVAIRSAAVSPPETVSADFASSRGSSPHADVVAMLPQRLLQSTATGTDAGTPTPYSVQRKPLEPDAAPPERATEDDQHAQVNVEELRTRVAGINLSLRTLEGEINEKRECTADQLDSLLSRLDILVLRQRDLVLFRDLIAPAEQTKVGQVESSRGAIATIGTRIAELRTRIRHDESLPEADRAAVLKHLDDLSDRLATLTAEK